MTGQPDEPLISFDLNQVHGKKAYSRKLVGRGVERLASRPMRTVEGIVQPRMYTVVPLVAQDLACSVESEQFIVGDAGRI